MLTAIEARVIFGPAAFRDETEGLIHCDRGVAVPHFEMHATDSAAPGMFDEVIEQRGADPPSLGLRRHGQQEQLRFVGHRAKQGEAMNRASAVTGKN